MSIEIRQLSKRFGDYAAVRDVDLQIEDGELLALLGPSGSGKTTLLRLIAGLETPDAGGITFARPADEAPAGPDRVGFVFQHYALFPTMTVFENVAFGLRVRPRKGRPSDAAIAEKVGALLALVQLDGMARRYPSQLSGGQRQRVALARALAIEPRVLLLDEPFGALDARVRKQLRAWLRRLHDDLGVTSVFVTHDQDEALEVADRVVVMNQGRIEQVGTPAEVFRKPASEFVMTFLGDVNLFRGRVAGGEVHLGGVALPAPAEAAGLEGDRAKLFVRPHELEITREPSDGGLAAKVVRVQTTGARARVELAADGVDAAFVAELGDDELDALHLATGEDVFVRPRRVRVFRDTAAGGGPA
jgi:sulfate transport system ATP-binding protein